MIAPSLDTIFSGSIIVYKIGMLSGFGIKLFGSSIESAVIVRICRLVFSSFTTDSYTFCYGIYSLGGSLISSGKAACSKGFILSGYSCSKRSYLSAFSLEIYCFLFELVDPYPF